MKMNELPRKTILMDHRGRITIPDYMRTAWKIPQLNPGQTYPLDIEIYPNLQNPKTIFIKKTWTPTPDPPGIP